MPIPGTGNARRLAENIGAARLALTVEDLRDIDDGTAAFDVTGERLPEAALRMARR